MVALLNVLVICFPASTVFETEAPQVGPGGVEAPLRTGKGHPPLKDGQTEDREKRIEGSKEPDPREGEAASSPGANGGREGAYNGDRQAMADARIRELEEAIRSEMDILEERVSSIRDRLRNLQAMFFSEASQTSLSREPERRPPAPLPEDEEEKRHEALVIRQDELVKKWRGLDEGAVKTQSTEAKAGEKLRLERKRVLDQLREVVSHILDLREHARERQIRRLRAELEDLEKVMKQRRDLPERNVLVESRLRELLVKPGASR